MTAIPITPCPFCGNTDPAIDEIYPGTWAVCCDECGAQGPGNDAPQDSYTAIKRWNTRAP